MRRSLVLATDAWGPTVELARYAESNGLHRVWTTEYATRDAVVRAVAIGAATTSLQVGTGIAYAFTRLPLATAAMAADAQLVTGGRFTLGLGAGTRGMRRRFYGEEGFDHPAPRLAEYVELVRSAWSASDGLSFTGTYYRGEVAGFAANDELAGLGPPPVYGSGLNPTMIRYSAASCDGVALHPVASVSHYLADVVAPAVAAGRAANERPAGLAMWRIASVHPDEQRARARVRAQLAFYFSTPSYAGVLERTRWDAVAQAVREEFARVGPRWDEIARVVPEDMVEAFALAGTQAQVTRHLVELEGDVGQYGVDEVVLQTVGVGMTDEETMDNCFAVVAAAGGDIGKRSFGR